MRINSIVGVAPAYIADYAERVKAFDYKAAFAFEFEDVTEDGSTVAKYSNGVAIESIVGPMVGMDIPVNPYITSSTNMARRIRGYANDPECKGLLIHCDSGGGSVAGVDELASAVAAFSASKPCAAHVTCSCSAAYWAISGASKIYADKLAYVGSLGVYCVLEDITGMLEKAGIKLTVVSTGEMKGAGADGSVTDPMIEQQQRIVDQINEAFKAAVKAGRKADTDALFTGGVWLAQESAARPLCDIGTKDDAVRYVTNEIASGALRSRAKELARPAGG